MGTGITRDISSEVGTLRDQQSRQMEALLGDVVVGQAVLECAREKGRDGDWASVARLAHGHPLYTRTQPPTTRECEKVAERVFSRGSRTLKDMENAVALKVREFVEASISQLENQRHPRRKAPGFMLEHLEEYARDEDEPEGKADDSTNKDDATMEVDTEKPEDPEEPEKPQEAPGSTTDVAEEATTKQTEPETEAEPEAQAESGSNEVEPEAEPETEAGTEVAEAETETTPKPEETAEREPSEEKPDEEAASVEPADPGAKPVPAEDADKSAEPEEQEDEEEAEDKPESEDSEAESQESQESQEPAVGSEAGSEAGSEEPEAEPEVETKSKPKTTPESEAEAEPEAEASGASGESESEEAEPTEEEKAALQEWRDKAIASLKEVAQEVPVPPKYSTVVKGNARTLNKVQQRLEDGHINTNDELAAEVYGALADIVMSRPYSDISDAVSAVEAAYGDFVPLPPTKRQKT